MKKTQMNSNSSKRTNHHFANSRTLKEILIHSKNIYRRRQQRRRQRRNLFINSLIYSGMMWRSECMGQHSYESDVLFISFLSPIAFACSLALFLQTSLRVDCLRVEKASIFFILLDTSLSARSADHLFNPHQKQWNPLVNRIHVLRAPHLINWFCKSFPACIIRSFALALSLSLSHSPPRLIVRVFTYRLNICFSIGFSPFPHSSTLKFPFVWSSLGLVRSFIQSVVCVCVVFAALPFWRIEKSTISAFN